MHGGVRCPVPHLTRLLRASSESSSAGPRRQATGRACQPRWRDTAPCNALDAGKLQLERPLNAGLPSTVALLVYYYARSVRQLHAAPCHQNMREREYSHATNPHTADPGDDAWSTHPVTTHASLSWACTHARQQCRQSTPGCRARPASSTAVVPRLLRPREWRRLLSRPPS